MKKGGKGKKEKERSLGGGRRGWFLLGGVGR